MLSDNRVRIGLAFVAVVIIFSLITLLFWGFVRDTVITPIYYALWVGGLILKSIPQGIFVALLAAIGIFVALSTLREIRIKPAEKTTQVAPISADTRYQHWRRLYDNLYISRFSRSLFLGDARRLILAILAYERSINTAEAEALVKSGAIPLPDGIAALIRQKETPEAAPTPGRFQSLRAWLDRWISRRQAQAHPSNPQVDELLDEVLNFLERHLEMPDGGSQPKA